MIFYFSGTGNSKWIASQLANVQDEQMIDIGQEMIREDNSFEYELRDNEKIGFVFPVYSWAPPKIVLDFIQNISLTKYKGNYLFFVCSCGDDTGLTRNVFLKAIDKKGWDCHAGFSLIMPNNYVLMKGFDTDDKELEKNKLRKAVTTMRYINDTISIRKKEFCLEEGSFPFFKTRIINPLFNKYEVGKTKPFYATDDCISCGSCQKACPVNNVTVEEKPRWGDYCVTCLACYHICPKNAVQYGKKTKNKGQYVNPNITL